MEGTKKGYTRQKNHKTLKFRCVDGRCTWKGPVSPNGIPDGMGEMTFSNGMKYYGEFRAGVRNSPSAIFKAPNWSLVGGPWVNDLPSRNGKFELKEVDYKGDIFEFVGGVKTKKETVKSQEKPKKRQSDRCCFCCCGRDEEELEIPMKGMNYRFLNLKLLYPTDIMKHGEKCETSILPKNDGRRKVDKLETYIGSYKNNKRDGRGVMMNYVRDFQYYGHWKNGLFHGKGILIYKNGDIFEGLFFEGRRKGFGSLLTSSGTKITGQWEGRTITNGKNEFVRRDSRTLPYMRLANFKEKTHGLQDIGGRPAEPMSVLDLTRSIVNPNPWKEMIQREKLEVWLAQNNFIPPPRFSEGVEKSTSTTLLGRRKGSGDFLSEEEARHLPYWSSLFASIAKEVLVRPKKSSKHRKEGNSPERRTIILPDVMKRIKKKSTRKRKKSVTLFEEELSISSNEEDSEDDSEDENMFFSSQAKGLDLNTSNGGSSDRGNYLRDILLEFKGWFFNHFHSKNRQVVSVSLRSARAYIICFVAAIEAAISEIFLKHSPEFFGASAIPRITLRVYITAIVHQLLYPLIFPMYVTQNSEKNISFKTKLTMLRKGELVKNMNVIAVFPPLMKTEEVPERCINTANGGFLNSSYQLINERYILNGSIVILDRMNHSNNLLSKLDLLEKFRNSVICEIKAHQIIKELLDMNIIKFVFDQNSVLTEDSTKEEEEEEEENEEKKKKDICWIYYKNVWRLKKDLKEVYQQFLYSSSTEQFERICPILVSHHLRAKVIIKLLVNGQIEEKEEENEETEGETGTNEYEISGQLDNNSQEEEEEETRILLHQLLNFKDVVNRDMVGADQLTPSYLYCMTKSKMNHLANFQYLKEWISEKWLSICGSPALTFIPLFESFFQIVFTFDPNVVGSDGGFVSRSQFREEMRLLISAAKERSLGVNWIIELFSCISIEVGSFRIKKLGDHVRKIGMILLLKEKYPILFQSIEAVRLGIPYFLKYQKAINIHSIEIVNLSKSELTDAFMIDTESKKEKFKVEESFLNEDDENRFMGDGNAIKIVFLNIYPSKVYENLATMAAELVERRD